MGDQEMRLMLNIEAKSDVNEEELAELTLQLKKRIRELDVKSVDLVREGKIPKGAMAGEAVIWGQLIVNLSSALIPILVVTIKRIFDSKKIGKIKITNEYGTIEMDGNPSKDWQPMIDRLLPPIMKKK